MGTRKAIGRSIKAASLVAFGAGAALLGAHRDAQAAEARGGRTNALTLVASFDHQVTGVTVSETGRIFVNFPRWTDDAPVSVAEMDKSGKAHPYPDMAWNAWRNANPLTAEDHFICVQSVVADGRGSLWVLDPAAPATEHVVKKGPKLVRIDLASNQVKQVIAFDDTVAPDGSYLNDVRFAPDGKTAYITDSGARGALIVVDLTSGKGQRVLDGHPATQPEDDVQIMIDGKALRRPDGRRPNFAADGIALSPAGDFLYWQALTGRTLYRIATAALADAGSSVDQIASKVEKLGATEPVDGLWMGKDGVLYLTAIQENAVKRRGPDGKLSIVVQDAKLRWPDTFGQGPDGTLYVTASHIQDSPWFHEKGWAGKKETQLFSIAPPK